MSQRSTVAAPSARLSRSLAELLRCDGPWTEAITRHAAVAQAARHLSDQVGQANALTHLGDARQLTGAYPRAGRDLDLPDRRHRSAIQAGLSPSPRACPRLFFRRVPDSTASGFPPN